MNSLSKSLPLPPTSPPPRLWLPLLLMKWRRRRSSRAQARFLRLRPPSPPPNLVLWSRRPMPTAFSRAMRVVESRRRRMLALARYWNLRASLGTPVPLPESFLTQLSRATKAAGLRPLVLGD